MSSGLTTGGDGSGGDKKTNQAELRIGQLGNPVQVHKLVKEVHAHLEDMSAQGKDVSPKVLDVAHTSFTPIGLDEFAKVAESDQRIADRLRGIDRKVNEVEAAERVNESDKQLAVLEWAAVTREWKFALAGSDTRQYKHKPKNSDGERGSTRSAQTTARGDEPQGGGSTAPSEAGSESSHTVSMQRTISDLEALGIPVPEGASSFGNVIVPDHVDVYDVAETFQQELLKLKVKAERTEAQHMLLMSKVSKQSRDDVVRSVYNNSVQMAIAMLRKCMSSDAFGLVELEVQNLYGNTNAGEHYVAFMMQLLSKIRRDDVRSHYMEVGKQSPGMIKATDGADKFLREVDEQQAREKLFGETSQHLRVLETLLAGLPDIPTVNAQTAAFWQLKYNEVTESHVTSLRDLIRNGFGSEQNLLRRLDKGQKQLPVIANSMQANSRRPRNEQGGRGGQCYLCGEKGHFKWNCPKLQEMIKKQHSGGGQNAQKAATNDGKTVPIPNLSGTVAKTQAVWLQADNFDEDEDNGLCSITDGKRVQPSDSRTKYLSSTLNVETKPTNAATVNSGRNSLAEDAACMRPIGGGKYSIKAQIDSGSEINVAPVELLHDPVEQKSVIEGIGGNKIISEVRGKLHAVMIDANNPHVKQKIEVEAWGLSSRTILLSTDQLKAAGGIVTFANEDVGGDSIDLSRVGGRKIALQSSGRVELFVVAPPSSSAQHSKEGLKHGGGRGQQAGENYKGKRRHAPRQGLALRARSSVSSGN